MEKGFHTGMNLVDLEKACNKLDHTVLLQKMECIGFKESNGFNHISQTESFCDIRKCLFRRWTNKLWCFTSIYLRATPLPNACK